MHKNSQSNFSSNRQIDNTFEFDNRCSTQSTFHALSTKRISKDVDLIERRELFIPGFMKINGEDNLRCIAFSILKTLVPSLTQSDISGVRFVRSKTTCSNSQGPLPNHTAFIVILKNPELVQTVMSAKKLFNYLTTKDISLSSLNSEVAIALPDRKIFINEVLSNFERSQYILIKENAKKLGFKYVWYNNGDFLVKWGERTRSHAVKTISDLKTIAQTLGTSTHNLKTPTKTYISSQYKHDTTRGPSTSQ